MKQKEKQSFRIRGSAAQQQRRFMERTVRIEAVAFNRWMCCCGLSRDDTACRLALSKSTVSSWERLWRESRLAPVARGRPAERTDRETREAIMALFQLMGPGVGLAVLQECFPGVARRELEDLQRRYRDVHTKRSQVLVHALIWPRLGSVWAMDYAVPPLPVDGIYASILVVRDLASGMQLAALPVERETAESVIGALQALFLEHSAPLVIKSDNGSAFTAALMTDFLRGRRIMHLLSPPRMPSYNGACEAGIGSLKTRAHHESARNDRPGEWTCDDVEAARLMSNETARPGGIHAPTPDERWRIRPVISPAERDRFNDAVEYMRNEERIDSGYLPGFEAGPAARAAADRRAITRALVAHGFLKLRRRRITLPISYRNRAEIS